MSYVEDAPARATSAKMPELVVEWLPTCGPGASDGDWCDITDYVTVGTTSRGRQYEIDAFKAGTCSITLQTFTRLFDPENTAGPFYPWLTPMRQLRVSAVWAGVRYPIFRGYITSWGQTQPSDKTFVTTLSVRDGFERLEQLKLPSSAWALEVQRDDPTCWLRLGESDTPRVTDSSAGGNYGIYDNCQQGQQGLVVNDGDGAVSFAHSLEERVKVQKSSLISGYPFTLSLAFKISGDDPNGLKVMFASATLPLGGAGTGRGIELVMIYGSNAGLVRANISDGTNYRQVYFSFSPWDDNLVHLAHFVATSASSFTAYMDGTDRTITGTGGTGAPTWPGDSPNGYTIGNVSDIGLPDYGFGVNGPATVDDPFPLKERGTLDEFEVYDGTVLSATRIAAQYEAFLGWDGDTTGDRIDRFLDAIDWPSTLRDIDTGISTLGSASWSAGSSALSVMQAWADTETGQFFIGTNGEVVFRSRHAPLLDANAMTSQSTFSDAHSAGLKCDEIDLPRDATLIRNPVSASRRNGVSVTVSDDALIDNKYGERTWAAPTTEDQKDSAVRDRATWLLARYKELGTRLAGLKLAPTQDATNLFPVALGRSIGDRVTVNRTPLGIGSMISVDQILEGVDHKFTPFTWETNFNGSPVDPNVGDYLILDDVTYGLLDTAELAY